MANLWQIASSTARADQGSRTLGNADEACFDLMSVAPGVIRKYNIGAGDDKTFYSVRNVRYGDLTLDDTVDIRDLVSLATTKAGTNTAADVKKRANKTNITGNESSVFFNNRKVVPQISVDNVNNPCPIKLYFFSFVLNSKSLKLIRLRILLIFYLQFFQSCLFHQALGS